VSSTHGNNLADFKSITLIAINHLQMGVSNRKLRTHEHDIVKYRVGAFAHNFSVVVIPEVPTMDHSQSSMSFARGLPGLWFSYRRMLPNSHAFATFPAYTEGSLKCSFASRIISRCV
jgi:hypothetical protein